MKFVVRVQLIIIACMGFGLSVCYAQIPPGYYTTATGTGYTLKTQLHNIIDDHTVQTYGALWGYYDNTDLDTDGFIYDMYSENPTGTDPYNFTWSVNQCGSSGYTGEGDCYNREHSMPKSWWGGDITQPMYTDIHHVIPTDGYVNYQRSNLPFGETTTPFFISSNGCEKGSGTLAIGYTGTVFEPLDEYKGDFARIYFYMATRYQDVIAGWPGSAMLNGTSNQVFSDWSKDMLLNWHENDPVSQKEIDRNNAIYYQVQGNRNPFVDHPEWAQAIWGDCPVIGEPTVSDTSRCGPGQLIVPVTPGAGGTNCNWYLSETGSSVYTGTSALVTISKTDTIYISSIDSFGCESTNKVPLIISVYNVPVVDFSGLNTSYVTTDAASNLIGNPSGGTFSGTGVSGNTFNPGVAGAGTHNITYSFTTLDGCTNSQTYSTNVNSGPTGGGNSDSDLIITAVYDGPISGNPKGIELYVTSAISDLSIYGVGFANNGGGTDGQEFTFPSVSANAGDFIYVATDSAGFASFLGFAPSYISGAAGINGNDAIELFKNGTLVDLFGDVGVDGVGQPWEYTDGWASRKNCTGPDTTFTAANWNYSGVDALDGEITNASATTPIPIGVYDCISCFTTYGVFADTACGSYTWNSITYFESNFLAKDTIVNNGGCDSIVTLNLIIYPTDTSTEVIEACESYTWNGITYMSDNNTATDTFMNRFGCDSIVTLNLTIHNTEYKTDVIFACGSYQWIDGVTYSSSNNTAKDTLLNQYGCDSIVSLNLTINQASFGTDLVNACGPYTWINGVTYSGNNNTAKDTLLNEFGCDSIVTLNLTVHGTNYGTHTVSACGTYTWNGIIYSSSNNTAKDTLQNQYGCDSIVTLDLTISDTLFTTDVIQSCSSITWNNVLYTSSNFTAKDTLKSVSGCDSIVTLNLTIHQSQVGVHEVTTCGSYTWNGVTYNQSNNTAKDTLATAFGCDSVVTLNLTILDAFNTTDTIESCGAYTWIDGNEYSTSNNTATFTMMSQQGCDSVITLNLTVKEVNVEVTALGVLLQANNGQASYQWLECDNNYALIPGANQQSYNVTSTGEYAVQLFQDGCLDTSSCNFVTVLSVDDEQVSQLGIYPNPSNGEVQLSLPSDYVVSESILITNIFGVQLMELQVETQNIKLNLEDQPAGVYLIRFRNQMYRMVKE